MDEVIVGFIGALVALGARWVWSFVEYLKTTKRELMVGALSCLLVPKPIPAPL